MKRALTEAVVSHELLASQLINTYPVRLLIFGIFGIFCLGTTNTFIIEGTGQFRHGVCAKSILIQLQPQKTQGVGAVIGIGDTFATDQSAFILYQGDIDLIIYFLLPILVARLATGIPVNIGRWQHFVQLTKLIFKITLGLANGPAGIKGNKKQDCA